MSLIWINAKPQTAAEKRAVRRHVQKRRAQVSRVVPTPIFRPIPGLKIWPTATPQERASLVFFERQTYPKWSGWQDLQFWSLAMSISQSCEAVAHALVAFAALHRGDYELAFAEHTKSMMQPQNCFEGLVSCMLIICFQNLTGQKSFRLLRSGLKMLEETADERIKPLYDLLKARPCMMPDLSAALDIGVRKMSPAASEVEVRPFATAQDARNTLMAILNHGLDLLALNKSVEPVRLLLKDWEDMLDAYDAHSVVPATSLLRAAALTGWILLEGREVDEYDVEFVKILDLIEQAEPTRMSFGIDGGVIDMLGFVGTKCRKDARYRALRLLKDRIEGDRIASMPAGILALQIDLERGGDRLRLIEGRQCNGKIELTFEGKDGRHDHEIAMPLKSDSKMPDAIFGPGYAAYLDGEEYWRIELDRFHFPMPRV